MKDTLSIAARRALRGFGANVRDARIRRRLTIALVAERAMISHVTVAKVERGDASVSLGACAAVLFVLGLVDDLGRLADIRDDDLGQQLATEQLPKRVRYKRSSHIKPPADE